MPYFSVVTDDKTAKSTLIPKGDIMSDNRIHDYVDDKSEGHVDTREGNFRCKDPDPNMGCDPGIDVAG